VAYFKQSSKQNSKRNILYSLITVIVVVLLVIVSYVCRKYLSVDNGTVIVSTVEAVAVIVSLIIAISQIKGSKEIARATFIVQLNQAYVENPDYMKLYNCLQECFDSECEHSDTCNNETKCYLEIEKGVVSNYLTFFETVYLLEKDGAISLQLLDDLFAYRFFLAVHSKFVQQVKLKTQPRNFKNIFCLEKKWLDYRKKRGVNESPTQKSVYNTRLLKDLIDPEVYEDLVKE